MSHASTPTTTQPDTQTTHVGHAIDDDCDHYVGRGSEGRCLHDLFDSDADVEIGDRGWLGNPYELGDDGDRDAVVSKFRADFETALEHAPTFRNAVAALHGSTLGCWCQRRHDDDPACHAEVIAEHADRLATDSQ